MGSISYADRVDPKRNRDKSSGLFLLTRFEVFVPHVSGHDIILLISIFCGGEKDKCQNYLW